MRGGIRFLEMRKWRREVTENNSYGFSIQPSGDFIRILNQELFLFLLDLEIKRARRYQNFLCLLILKLKENRTGEDCWDRSFCFEILSDLLRTETRESDILGTIGEGELCILLPYADESSGKLAQSRFEETLKYFNFRNRGYDILISQICYPVQATNLTDLVKKVLEK